MKLKIIHLILKTLLPLVLLFVGAFEYNSGTKTGVIAGAIFMTGAVIAIAVENR